MSGPLAPAPDNRRALHLKIICLAADDHGLDHEGTNTMKRLPALAMTMLVCADITCGPGGAAFRGRGRAR
ncbi:hypothetical protein H4696_000591 [Amycolatopsis lexingtonensis]|uniref:Uncharacterized protein n=1 Tax=Amycolatopsis lexingtonensis TaxID=218822 RepID=A0ABR9HRD7_9PSEU|nr:hypothetical protein [Amycolatopsis lexingtonensis]